MSDEPYNDTSKPSFREKAALAAMHAAVSNVGTLGTTHDAIYAIATWSADVADAMEKEREWRREAAKDA